MNENELRNRAYKIACDHGWHDVEHSDAHWLMLIITEIAECVQADRKNKHADRDEYIHLTEYAMREDMLSGEILEQYEREAFENHIKDTVEDEMADICIRCYDLAGLRNIDLDSFHPEDCNVGVIQELINQPLPEFMHYMVSRFSMSPKAYFDLIDGALYAIAEYASQKNIPLLWYIKEKMMYNDKRPYKHGCEY